MRSGCRTSTNTRPVRSVRLDTHRTVLVGQHRQHATQVMAVDRPGDDEVPVEQDLRGAVVELGHLHQRQPAALTGGGVRAGRGALALSVLCPLHPQQVRHRRKTTAVRRSRWLGARAPRFAQPLASRDSPRTVSVAISEGRFDDARRSASATSSPGAPIVPRRTSVTMPSATDSASCGIPSGSQRYRSGACRRPTNAAAPPNPPAT